jgi:hypothetical protein
MITPGSRERSPVPEGTASHPPAPHMTGPRDGADSGGAVTGRTHPPAQPRTAAAALRAAADFIESAGLPSGLHVICGDGEVRISVWEPYEDVTARIAIVAKLAGLIGGPVRQHDNPDHAISDLRADGAIGGLRAAVKTTLPVRRTRPPAGEGRPLAESPTGRITAVPGSKLPGGWRWVTEPDTGPKRPSPWRPRGTAAATQAPGQAPGLAARGRLPW